MAGSTNRAYRRSCTTSYSSIRGSRWGGTCRSVRCAAPIRRAIGGRLFVHPWPRLLLDDEAPEAYGAGSGYGAEMEHVAAGGDGGPVRPDTVEVIDDFLETFGAGGERIVPPPPPRPGMGGEEFVQEDISAASVAEDGQIATETLAEIYLAQGLPDRAIEIYSKLSLKYPEKSLYFADLIADVRGRFYGGR